jgi:hypothetical protein
MLPYARAVAIGGTVGIAFAAPQFYAFLHFLGEAYIGGHNDDFAHAAFGWAALAPSIATPYLMGPPMGYTSGRPLLEIVWGGLGGYVTAALLPVAAFGFMHRRDAISWLLLAWIVLAFGKSFGIEPAVTLLNLVPGVDIPAFYRYAPPSWELALVILAMRGLGTALGNPSRNALAVAYGAAAVVMTVAAISAWKLWPMLEPVRGLRNAATGSIAWMVLSIGIVLFLLSRLDARRAFPALAVVLALDAMLMAFIPTLGNPRGGKINQPAVTFLQQNLGVQRFFTLGPIQPNYGAYFGIASINHNYLPVARRWVDWVRAQIDPHIDEVNFVGSRPRPPGVPTESDALRANLAAYEWVGVKYVIATGKQEPLAGVPGVKPVYTDDWMTIYELPAPKPYFESENGRCQVRFEGRDAVRASCSGPDRLVRRELSFPGWSARIGGRDATVDTYRELFQSVDVPAGSSEVRFLYAPPHIGWAWLAMALAAVAFAASFVRRAPRSAASGRSAS